MKKIIILLLGFVVLSSCRVDDEVEANLNDLDYVLGGNWYLVDKISSIDGNIYFECNTDDLYYFTASGVYGEDYGRNHCTDYESLNGFVEGDWSYFANRRLFEINTRNESWDLHIESASRTRLVLSYDVVLGSGVTDTIYLHLER